MENPFRDAAIILKYTDKYKFNNGISERDCYLVKLSFLDKKCRLYYIMF